MNEPSYFDDPRAAKKLRDEAISWKDTPFAEYYQEEVEASGVEKQSASGVHGGIDCVGLVQKIFEGCGAVEKFVFQRTPADYQSHQTGEKILDWLRGKVDDPQSKKLAEILTELAIPDVMKDAEAEKPCDFFKPGDILVLKHGSLFHLPVIYNYDLDFVSALPRIGVTEGTIQDSTYSIHLVAAFRLKPK